MPPTPHTTPDGQPIGTFALTSRIVAIAFFTFICYLAIGLPLAVLPGYVHGQLGYGSVLAGLAISVQYVATLLSRSHAGRMADTVGPKQTVVIGMAACAASGVFLLLAYAFERSAWLSLAPSSSAGWRWASAKAGSAPARPPGRLPGSARCTRRG